MLALIAGRGALPDVVVSSLAQPPLICALHGSEPERLQVAHHFHLEQLGGLLAWLETQGVTQMCLCGAITRGPFRPMRLDFATIRLIPRILRALRSGDDGALRIAMALFEEHGIQIVAAHEAAPDLLPPSGVLTQTQPDDMARQAACQGDLVSQEQAAADLGQSCILRGGQTLAREGAAGTDAMLAALGHQPPGAVFYKAPKPGQDLRADLPVIGPQTAQTAVDLGLSGLIIEAGGVMVLDRARVLDILNAAGLFLWVRERPL